MFERVLRWHLKAAMAIWESIVAIWRLEKLPEDHGDSEIWQYHAMSWLVSLLSYSDRFRPDELRDSIVT